MKTKRKIRMFIGIIVLLFFVSIPFFNEVRQYILIPNKLITYNNQSLSVPPFGSNVSIATSHDNMVLQDDTLLPQQIGDSQLVYKMANVPVKKVDVEILKDKKIIPGGQSVGVKLQTLGVLVVGHHIVNTQKKNDKSPAENADILVGDVIIEMNNSKIKQMEDVKPIVKKAGKEKQPIKVKLKRGNKEIETSLKPILNKKDHTYQIGLYIRDSATGIGTVSFYEQGTGKYGALGHIISDADTKKPLDIIKGKIVNSSVTAIEKGNKGIPGEKQANFSMKDHSLGSVSKNTPFGIFGKLKVDELINHSNQPMPIGLSKEVKEGPAHILTVLEGNKVEKFDIEIINSIPQKYPGTKGMVIKVTDKTLLDKTGGIVQGMSGSPIIQNGKLVGAVTHVFVNDPTSGYGVHIEWMLEEAGIDILNKKEKQAS